MSVQIEDSLEEQLGVKPLEVFELYGGKIKLLYDDDAHKYYLDGQDGRVQVPNATTVLDTLDKSNALMAWAIRCVIQSLEDSLGINQAIAAGVAEHAIVGPWKVTHLAEKLETARKAHRVRKDDAADVGKQAHKWLETYGKLTMAGYTGHHIYNHNPLPKDQRAVSCIKAALKWFEEHHVTFMECERKVYSQDLNSCGTTDLIAMVDGKLTLLDYKSSNGLYDIHRFQLAFYKSAYEEETGEHIDQRILLRLGKDEGEFEAHVLADENEALGDLMAFKGLLVTYERVQEIKLQKAIEKDTARDEKKAVKKSNRAKGA